MIKSNLIGISFRYVDESKVNQFSSSIVNMIKLWCCEFTCKINKKENEP